MDERGRTTASLAIILIFVGIALPLGYELWMTTRTFVALDVPVSLSPSHIRTVDFAVNLTGWYQIGVAGDDRFFYRQGCAFGASDPLLKTRSAVYRDGSVLQPFDGTDRFLGHFYAERGKRYSLDIEVLTDASCFNSGHPRIFVWTPSADYELLFDQLLTLSVVLALGGVGILAFSKTRRIEKRGAAPDHLAIKENVGYEHHPSRRKVPLKARFSQPPSFGLVYSLVLGTVLMPSFLIFYYIWGYDQHSKGIEVHLVSLGPLRTPPDVGLTPVVVRIEYRGDHTQPGLYLNSKPIPLESLSASLKTQLKTRSEWVVYVEADSNVDWADAMNAIDIIREPGAKIVLLTTEVTAPSRSTNHARRR